MFLSLFATGVRGVSGPAAVSTTVDGNPVDVQFAGSQGQFAGLDQVNLGPLPRSLEDRGDVEIRLVVDGRRANIVTVRIGATCEPQGNVNPGETTCSPPWSGPGRGVVPAFPGAQGYGATTPGGRAGRVIAVTTLADSGPGSLRDALSAIGPRIIVFRVGGTIELKSQLEILEPFVTVAGQTAPGGGITLRAAPDGGGQMLTIRTHDVVLRYLRVRSGNVGKAAQGQVNIQVDSDAHDVIIDHCSLSWSLDENFNISRNIPEGADPAKWRHIFNVSLQRSLLAEGLLPHSTGSRVGGEFAKEGWRGIHEISLHHNLYVANNARNPNIAAMDTRIINNVVYQWGSELGATVAGSAVDWIGNYWQPGNLSAIQHALVHNHFERDFPQNVFRVPSLYMAGN
ncbi:MAG: hypothetical protein GY953_10570, partial [bacterium]|nr:hypothetical protein [bacterium]